MKHIDNRKIDNNYYNVVVRKEKQPIMSCQGG